MNKNQQLPLFVTVFAIAMAFLESSVVIYLRALFYPEGFSFPLQPMPAALARVEIVREAATLIMLLMVAWLASPLRIRRFAFFNLAFGVWDLFYYVFLRLFIGWPARLDEWDILFLIPVPWVGPVWAPCLLSLFMIAGSLAVLRKTETEPGFRIRTSSLWIMIAGALVCIGAFTADYLQLQARGEQPPVSGLFADMDNYVPQDFMDPLFFLGFFLMAGGALHSLIKPNKTPMHEKQS